MIEFSGGLYLIAAAALGGLLLQALRRLRETRLACAGFERERAAAVAVLDTVPLAGFRWPLGPDHQGVAIRTDPYPQFLARFDAVDAERVCRLGYRRARLTIRRRARVGNDLSSTGAPHGRLRLGACLGLIFGMGLSIKNGLKGWANIYLKDFHKEGYYEAIYWNYIGTLMLVCLAVTAIWLLIRPLPRRFRGDVFPHAFGMMWFVLFTQHVIALLVTGPLNQWAEAIQWWIYYLLLFIISATIVWHFHFVKRHVWSRDLSPANPAGSVEAGHSLAEC